MSQREEKISKLLEFPYDAFLMVRLEYVHILGDELEAKLLRIIEKYIDQERKNIYQKMLNTAGTSPHEKVEITRDIWVPISYRLFMHDLFGTVTSENTVKRAIRNMINKKIIFQRFEPKKKYDAPEYKIHVNVLQMLLNVLKNPGYQNLIPSIIDTLKKRPPQELTPSECQNLIPSPEKSSSDQNLRVSKNGTNVTGDYGNNITSITDKEGVSANASMPHVSDDLSEHDGEEDDGPPTERMPAITTGKQFKQVVKSSASQQTLPVEPAAPETPPTVSASSTQEAAPEEKKETATQKKARLKRREAEIAALYCQLMGRQVVMTRDNKTGAKDLAEAQASDAEITQTYHKVKKDKFWGPKMTLSIIAKFLDATVTDGQVIPTTAKPRARPKPEDRNITIFETDPYWQVWGRPGEDQEWIWWQGEFWTPEEADERGYNGGGGLYVQSAQRQQELQQELQRYRGAK